MESTKAESGHKLKELAEKSITPLNFTAEYFNSLNLTDSYYKHFNLTEKAFVRMESLYNFSRDLNQSTSTIDLHFKNYKYLGYPHD